MSYKVLHSESLTFQQACREDVQRWADNSLSEILNTGGWTTGKMFSFTKKGPGRKHEQGKKK